MAGNASVIDEASFMDLLMNGLIDRVDALESKVELLEGKFDAWQKLVESILGTAQTAMQYDNNVLTFLGIGAGILTAIVAIAIAVMSYIYNKKKEDAIDEAIKKIDDSLAKGVLPEKSRLRSKIIDTIIKSDEFRLAVEDIFDYPNESKEADDNQEDKTGADKEPITPLDMKEKPVSGNER